MSVNSVKQGLKETGTQLYNYETKKSEATIKAKLLYFKSILVLFLFLVT